MDERFHKCVESEERSVDLNVLIKETCVATVTVWALTKTLLNLLRRGVILQLQHAFRVFLR